MGQLDLPSVHFMCNHSYHQRWASSLPILISDILITLIFSCIAENETECPACAREHGVIREIRQNNLNLVDQHDVFLSEVQDGGFAAIASAFGRGVLNMSRLEDARVAA